MIRLPAIVGGLLLTQVLCANAQTVYVDDRLQLGLHTQATLSSPIAQLLSSGTDLLLLERDGALVKVRTAAGVEGWVDGNYLSSVQPARARLQAMEEELADSQAELAGAQAALADLQAKLVVLEQGPQQVASERAADDSAKLPAEALREMQVLAEENQRLKQRVAELEAVQRMAQELAASQVAAGTAVDTTQPTASIADSDEAIINFALLKHWHLILLASVLLLAFALGSWLVDWGIRRRHGGFRI